MQPWRLTKWWPRQPMLKLQRIVGMMAAQVGCYLVKGKRINQIPINYLLRLHHTQHQSHTMFCPATSTECSRLIAEMTNQQLTFHWLSILKQLTISLTMALARSLSSGSSPYWMLPLVTVYFWAVTCVTSKLFQDRITSQASANSSINSTQLISFLRLLVGWTYSQNTSSKLLKVKCVWTLKLPAIPISTWVTSCDSKLWTRALQLTKPLNIWLTTIWIFRISVYLKMTSATSLLWKVSPHTIQPRVKFRSMFSQVLKGSVWMRL